MVLVLQCYTCVRTCTKCMVQVLRCYTYVRTFT